MRWVVHRGAEPWLPSLEVAQALDRAFPGSDQVLHLWPRTALRRLAGAPSDPWAFRAFTRGVVSHLFVAAPETPESVGWLAGHELEHGWLRAQGKAALPLRRALLAGRPSGLDPKSDHFHVVDPEERWADEVATELTGQRLDRAWWRKRVGF